MKTLTPEQAAEKRLWRPYSGRAVIGRPLATRRRMASAGITSLVFITTMLSAPGQVPAKISESSAQGTRLEVEVVERRGAQPSNFGFVVPTDGKVEAWISGGDDARRCKVSAEPRRGGTHLDLRCDGGKEHELRVEATRGFAAGKRVKVAEVQRPGGAKSQVFVTLR